MAVDREGSALPRGLDPRNTPPPRLGDSRPPRPSSWTRQTRGFGHWELAQPDALALELRVTLQGSGSQERPDSCPAHRPSQNTELEPASGRPLLLARGEGSEKGSTAEAADQLRLFLPVLIQALSLQLLPLEFVPLLNLQISVEVGQLQRRKIQLQEEKRGRLTTSCMVTNDSSEETDLREETPEAGRRSPGPGCSRSRSRSRTRMSKGPLCTAWSPPALRPQAHPPASVDTASQGSPRASAA